MGPAPRPDRSPDSCFPGLIGPAGRHGLGLFLVFLVLVAGCSRTAPTKTHKLVEVDVVTPVADEVQDHQDFTGRLDADAIVAIRARVTGYIEKAPFDEGDYVRGPSGDYPGDVLFYIDSKTYDADLAQAEANLKQSIAERTLQELNAIRARQMVNSRSIGKEEYDTTIGARDKAKATVLAMEAARDRASVYVGYCKVRAPMSGRISRRAVDPGNLVKQDDTLLTTLVNDEKVKAYFDVDERTYLDLVGEKPTAVSMSKTAGLKLPVLMRLANEEEYTRQSTPLTMGLWAVTNPPANVGSLGLALWLAKTPVTVPIRQGYVDFIDNQLNGNTGTIRMRGIFPNPYGVLKSGLFVRIRLPIGKPYRSLLVPAEALQSDQGRQYVFVVDESNHVQYRSVTVGPAVVRQGTPMRVIRDGLREGDRVVVTNMQRVRARDEVVVRDANSAPPGSLVASKQ
jgi:multidrug efflux pump subunit AcrA (membrane-fusion protein)